MNHSNSESFRFLSSLIRFSSEITLDSDIVLEDSDIKHFDDGIYILKSDITLDGNGHTIDCRNKARVFYNIGQNITIKNLTFKNGNTTKKEGTYSQRRYGGAIYNLGEITFENCKFHDNQSHSFGGAITNQNNSILRLSGCEFINNRSHEAGAIFNKSILKIDNCLFKSNSAVGYGGAITNEGFLKLNNSIFCENSCGESGGAINNYIALLESKNSKFIKNTSIYRGGSINSFSGFLKLKNLKFIENKSARNGEDNLRNIGRNIKAMNCEFR